MTRFELSSFPVRYHGPKAQSQIMKWSEQVELFLRRSNVAERNDICLRRRAVTLASYPSFFIPRIFRRCGVSWLQTSRLPICGRVDTCRPEDFLRVTVFQLVDTIFFVIRQLDDDSLGRYLPPDLPSQALTLHKTLRHASQCRIDEPTCWYHFWSVREQIQKLLLR